MFKTVRPRGWGLRAYKKSIYGESINVMVNRDGAAMLSILKKPLVFN
jgi:hypothetical protein